MRYQVEHFTLCDGWINCWTDANGDPITYDSLESAQSELKDYLEDTIEAALAGDLAEPYSAEDFRIVVVQ